MFNVKNKINGNVFVVYDIKCVNNKNNDWKYELGKTYFLIYNIHCSEWQWRCADNFEPIGIIC